MIRFLSSSAQRCIVCMGEARWSAERDGLVSAYCDDCVPLLVSLAADSAIPCLECQAVASHQWLREEHPATRMIIPVCLEHISAEAGRHIGTRGGDRPEARLREVMQRLVELFRAVWTTPALSVWVKVLLQNLLLHCPLPELDHEWAWAVVSLDELLRETGEEDRWLWDNLNRLQQRGYVADWDFAPKSQGVTVLLDLLAIRRRGRMGP